MPEQLRLVIIFRPPQIGARDAVGPRRKDSPLFFATTTIGKASKMADYRDERNTTSPLPTAKISHGRFKNAKLNKIDSKGRHGGVKKSTSKCTQPVARPSTPRAYATPQDTMDTESNTEVREAAAMATTPYYGGGGEEAWSVEPREPPSRHSGNQPTGPPAAPPALHQTRVGLRI